MFRDELRDITVKYKANATFVCKVVGHPKPVIKWYRRGKEIQPDGQKIKAQEFKGGYYQLVITAAVEDDATVYQIRATNQEGSISTTVNLDVEGMHFHFTVCSLAFNLAFLYWLPNLIYMYIPFMFQQFLQRFTCPNISRAWVQSMQSVVM